MNAFIVFKFSDRFSLMSHLQNVSASKTRNVTVLQSSPGFFGTLYISQECDMHTNLLSGHS